MKCYFKYGWYVIKHKYFVMLECWKYGLIWRGIIHDMSKFRPSEFIPYAKFFYGKDKPLRDSIRDESGYYKPYNTGCDAFDRAWTRHCRRNSHHFQYWAMCRDGDDIEGKGVFPVEFPNKDVIEMVCDWYGASRAQKATKGVDFWYKKNKNKLVLHPNTRKEVERLLKNKENDEVNRAISKMQSII